MLKLLLLLTLGWDLQAAPALKSHTTCNVVGNTCTTGAIDNTGATVIVAYESCLYGNATTSVVITDSSSNTWSSLTLQGPVTGGGTVVFGQLFYVVGPTVTASQTFTETSNQTACTLFVASFSGTLSSSALDTSSGANSGSTVNPSTIQPGSITPGASGELLISGLATYCVTSCTTTPVAINSSFSTIDTANPNTQSDGGLAYLVQSVAAGINPTWSADVVSGGMATNIIAFKIPGGATAPPPQPSVLGIL